MLLCLAAALPLLSSLPAFFFSEMTDDVEAPRFPQYMSEVAETKEEKGEGVSMDTSATSKRQSSIPSLRTTLPQLPSPAHSASRCAVRLSATWQYALTESELLPESDTLLLWLTRFSVEKNHPRPLTGRVQAYVAVGEVMALKKDEKLPQAFMVRPSCVCLAPLTADGC